MGKEKISGIYCIENLMNHKKYIGQSRNIYNRWSQHRQSLKNNKHENWMLQEDWNRFRKDDFSFYVLEECPIVQLDEREVFWIAKLNTQTDGYNITKGGDDHFCNHILTEQQVLKIIDELKGGNKSNAQIARDYGVYPSTIGAICNHQSWCHLTNGIEFEPRKKQIDMYSQSGEYIKTFKTINKAAKAVGVSPSSISAVVHGKARSVGGYIWRFEGHPFNEFWTIVGETHWKAINQFDENWNLVKSYCSLTEASKETGINLASISSVLKKKYKTAGGYYWLYADEDLPQDKTIFYKVDQYDLKWQYVCSHKTITSAAKEVGVQPSNISSAIAGRIKTAGGFYWLRHGEKSLAQQELTA